jgi:glycyl-tRNA synthetase
MSKIYDVLSKLQIEGGADAMLDTCKRRFFFTPSFEIYNGVAGLYDYGPVLTAIKANALSLWRAHFIIEEEMVEIEPTCLTPEDVFITSGHVERFNDVMTKDVVTGECFRLDKYAEDYCDRRLNDPKDKMTDATRQRLVDLKGKIDGMTPAEMGKIITEFNMKSPKNNELSAPFAFNLMFRSSIGPEGTKVGYLRPELAQGIFMNFKKMLNYNNGKMPFAGAATGMAFRNEIAPRGGLLRVREFQLAEIEHFVNPSDKSHPKFQRVKDLEVPLFSRERQEANEQPILMTIGEAVDQHIIDNETLGYFMGRVYMFLRQVGAKYIRFRQHRSKEMAHYAKDCWDAELLNAMGWLECVGIADRACFDLDVHSRKTNVDMCAYESYPQPIEEEYLERKLDKTLIGKAFKKDAGRVSKYLQEELSVDGALTMEKTLASQGTASVRLDDGTDIVLERKMVEFSTQTRKVNGRNYTPSVIEPSFGVGRILWCVLEQTYFLRASADEDAQIDKSKPAKGEKRAGFSLPARISPYKVMICPLMVKPELVSHIPGLASSFSKAMISFKVDDTGAPIGRRYARTDELGVPFVVTVDYTTNTDDTITLRERDSCTQVRMPKTDVVDCILRLCNEQATWAEMQATYPEQKADAAEKVGR